MTSADLFNGDGRALEAAWLVTTDQHLIRQDLVTGLLRHAWSLAKPTTESPRLESSCFRTTASLSK
jgi:hypothetical protein